MAKYDTIHSNKNRSGKEPHTDAIAVWSGAEPENLGDGRVTKGACRLGEYWLWKSVIAQALQDAASFSNDRKMKSVRAEAIAWFSLADDSFLFVCELAGLCPKTVLQRSKEVIADAQKESSRLRRSFHTKKRWKWLGQCSQKKGEEELRPSEKQRHHMT